MSDRKPSIMLNGSEPLEALGDDEARRVTSDLKRRVENWKNIDPKIIGRLVMFDCLYITPPKCSAPKLYCAYLFNNIFIVCKDEKLRNSSSRRSKPSHSDSKMSLKGRILASDVFDIVLTEDDDSYVCSVYWFGEGQSHVLSIHFSDVSQMTLWVTALKQMRL